MDRDRFINLYGDIAVNGVKVKALDWSAGRVKLGRGRIALLRGIFTAGVQALLALAGEACTLAIGNLPKLFRMHS